MMSCYVSQTNLQFWRSQKFVLKLLQYLSPYCLFVDFWHTALYILTNVTLRADNLADVNTIPRNGRPIYFWHGSVRQQSGVSFSRPVYVWDALTDDSKGGNCEQAFDAFCRSARALTSCHPVALLAPTGQHNSSARHALSHGRQLISQQRHYHHTTPKNFGTRRCRLQTSQLTALFSLHAPSNPFNTLLLG